MRTLSAALATVVVFVGGCAGSPEPTPPDPFRPTFAAAPCPRPNLAGLPELDLGSEFSCGYLTVPENRAVPEGRTIKIAVARAKATSPNPRPDPLVYLTGGPGGPGLPLGNDLIAAGLNRDRDLIVVDQRGTLHAQPALTCPEIDEFNAAATGTSILAPTTAERDLAAVRTCRDRLGGDGVDLAAYDTAENASDIADLRTTLGIDQWNVYGVSYGSDLALQLLRDHPDGIRTLTIDSVVPPQVNLIEQFWPNAAEGFTALFDACAAQPRCARSYPGLADEFIDTVHRLADTPAIVDLPGEGGAPGRRVVIDGYKLANLVISTTLSTPAISALPRVIHAIATGDPTPVARLLAGSPTPPGIIGYGLTYGVFCRESVAFTNTASILAAAQQVLPAFPAAVLSLPPQAPRVVDECAAWNVGTADDAVHAPVRSDVPTLLLAGTLDAVTPPSQADLAAQGLTSGRVVRIPGSGHDVLSRSTCAQQILADFLDAPTTYESACAATLRPAEFD